MTIRKLASIAEITYIKPIEGAASLFLLSNFDYD